MMTTVIFILALYAHVHAFLTGLGVLHKYQTEFSSGCIFDHGLSDIEKCYLAIVISTIIAPVTMYHIGLKLWRGDDFVENVNLNGLYWGTFGVLLTIFHVIVGKFMQKARESGLHTGTIETNR